MKKLSTPHEYYLKGCGRCEKFSTPFCKVNTWRNQLLQLREILLSTALKEEIKWGLPVFTFKGKNIVLLSAFNEYVALSFFYGAMLEDPDNILKKPGEHTEHARIITIYRDTQIDQLKSHILQFVNQSIKIVLEGKKPQRVTKLPPIPEELHQKFAVVKGLKEAFEKLTPGKQRGYLIYFWSAKTQVARVRRIEKCVPRILAGKGLHE